MLYTIGASDLTEKLPCSSPRSHPSGNLASAHEESKVLRSPMTEQSRCILSKLSSQERKLISSLSFFLPATRKTHVLVAFGTGAGLAAALLLLFRGGRGPRPRLRGGGLRGWCNWLDDLLRLRDERVAILLLRVSHHRRGGRQRCCCIGWRGRKTRGSGVGHGLLDSHWGRRIRRSGGIGHRLLVRNGGRRIGRSGGVGHWLVVRNRGRRIRRGGGVSWRRGVGRGSGVGRRCCIGRRCCVSR